MINIIIPLNERMKRAGFSKGFFPDEPGTICLRVRVVVPHAKHPFTLDTNDRFTGTGLQIIFEDPDGRSIGVDHAKVMNGAGHFTQTAATAFFRIYF